MNISHGDQLSCVLREIKFRERVYPRQVAEGKMTQAFADAQLTAMRAVAETLRPLAAGEELPL